jgi:hypothetical protein
MCANIPTIAIPLQFRCEWEQPQFGHGGASDSSMNGCVDMPVPARAHTHLWISAP